MKRLKRAAFVSVALSFFLSACSTAPDNSVRTNNSVPPGPTLPPQASLQDGVLTLSNERISRRFLWNEGNLQSIDLTNIRSGHRWKLDSETPDIAPFGEVLKARNGKLQTRNVPKSPTVPAYLEAVISFSADQLEVKRTCQIFKNVPAIHCQLAYRGGQRQKQDKAPTSREMIENAKKQQTSKEDRIEYLALPKGHWSFEAVQFRAATDYIDWLTSEEEGEIYRRDQRIDANIIRLEERVTGEQILLVKEAPIGADQVAWPGYDFVLRDKNVAVVGGGIDPATLHADTWKTAYSASVVVAGPGRYEALKSLREYRESWRTYSHARDGMILMNTWGDRNRDASMNEAFVLRELEAAHRLGLSHFQLDDGWQAGLSKNSSKAEGEMWESWTRAAWQVHKVRFPQGLAPVVKRAEALEIELGLWFNPTSKNEYALWERDADVLTDIYAKHGIRIFKLDGVDIPTRQAEQNFGKFLKRVYEKTNGEVVFNIDVTAGRRLGFIHPLNSYGNIFIENRYTDWANYYPYRTLRNLWALSAYVPPQFLQVEFLNISRNADKYPKDDPFAPANVSFEYAFATTMMGQPLAWFEASNLPVEAQKAAPAIKRYRKLAPSIHSGRIYPIGYRPNGASWTGFQSVLADETTGYLLVFRENNQQDTAHIKTFLPENQYACFTPELGSGAKFETRIGAEGQIEVQLEAAHSYALYSYQLSPEKQKCAP